MSDQVTQGNREERGQPDVLELVDATTGDWDLPGESAAIRMGVLSEIDADTEAPKPSEEGYGFFDPLCLRWHNLGRDLPSGAPDRRMSITTVNDFEGPQAPPEPDEVPYGQLELYSSENRSTRERDLAGRVALPSSLRRLMDAEDGRYALALRAPGPDQVEPEPSTISAPSDRPTQFPEGIFVFEAGQRLGGLPSAPSAGISVRGITFFGSGAIRAATTVAELGGDAQQIAAAASAGFRGQPIPDFALPEAGQTQVRETLPEPQRNAAGNVSPIDRPGGYVTDGNSIGLLGCFFDPDGFLAPYFTGGEGTPIGPLPMRHDAQVSTGGDNPKVGRIAFSPNEAASVERGSGKLVKGELWHDSSRANQNTALGNETGEWVPVIAVDAEKITWDPGRVPPGIDFRPDPDEPEEAGPKPSGTQPSPFPVTPQPGGGPGGSGLPGGSELVDPGLGGITVGGGDWVTEPEDGHGRSSGDCPKPAGGTTTRPGTSTTPRGGGGGSINGDPTGGTGGSTRPTTGGGTIPPRPDGVTLPPQPNPSAQARDLSPSSAVPCPNRTAGTPRPGTRSGSTGSGATGAGPPPGPAPQGPADPFGHPAITTAGGAIILGGSQGSDPPEPPKIRSRTRAEAQLERWRGTHARQRAKAEEELATLERAVEIAEAEADALREIGRPNQARWQDSRAAQARARLERARRRYRELIAKQKEREAYYIQKAARSRGVREANADGTPSGNAPLTQGGYAMEVVGAELEDAVTSDFREGDPQGTDPVAQTTGEAEWGAYNVLNRLLPLPGTPGSPTSVQDYMTLVAATIRSLQSVTNGAFGGPGYLAGNLAVIDEGSPHGRPTGSVIGTRTFARAGEQVTAGAGQSALEVRSQARVQSGGQLDLHGDGVFSVVRDTGKGRIRDRRPAILVENRGEDTGADVFATHDGKARIDGDHRGTLSGLNLHRGPGGEAKGDFLSLGFASGLGQKAPCGDPEEEVFKVGADGRTCVGPSGEVTIQPDGVVCLAEVGEEPGEPESPGAKLFVKDGDLLAHINGQESPVSLTEGGAGGGSEIDCCLVIGAALHGGYSIA